MQHRGMCPDSHPPLLPRPPARAGGFWRAALAWAAAAALLVGCGGGSGGSGSPSDALPAEPTSALDATRLAQQASFGATEALVQQIAAQGVRPWLQAQFALNRSRYRSGGDAGIHQWDRQDSDFCSDKGDTCWRDYHSTQPLLWDFYRNAIGQPDQLRQRVAYALQQILVVSGHTVHSTYGLRRYHNLLLEQAFGNYRELLRRVILSPVMGDYLNQVNNHRDAPNENFARELLQLFTLGTCRLEMDGRLSGGSCRPTYDNAGVRALAYALTGWTYPAGGRSPWGCWPEGARCPFHDGDLSPVPAFHDTAARSLPGGVELAAGHSPAQALERVLDALMQHPNLAPFIGRQLIQHLVTSNPSPAYVQRVAQAFNRGRHDLFGSGRVGDLQATVAAILLDEEARGEGRRGASFGRLREPVLYFTGVLRALNGHSDGEALGWWWGEALRQQLFLSPSVFNFYPPDHPLPGQGERAGPPFALQGTAAAIDRFNFLHYLLFWGGTAAADSQVPQPLGTGVALEAFLADATDPARLVDRLSRLAQGEPLPTVARQAVIQAVTAIDAQVDPSDWRAHRVRQAAWLVLGSPYFQIQR